MKKFFPYVIAAVITTSSTLTLSLVGGVLGTTATAQAGALNCNGLSGSRHRRCLEGNLRYYKAQSRAASNYRKDTRRVGKALEYTSRVSCHIVTTRFGRVQRICRHTPRLR